MAQKVTKSDAEWRAELSPEQYEIMRRKGTEPPFTGKFTHSKESGIYRCGACGAELFSSDSKFDSGSGWPSFTEASQNANIELRADDGHGMHRTEVVCGTCEGHLGHVFDDGPGPNGQRFCINSCALDLDTDAAGARKE